MKRRTFLWQFGVAALGAGVARAADVKTDGEIRLITRGDDIGSCHAANEACIQVCRDGIVKSLEIMVPCPWYPEAVKMLNENPSIDVGVHLTLTSEWDNIKWGPLTHAPSLVDRHGYFYPMTGKRPDFPAGASFLEAKPKLEEVEKELRAQIELAKAQIPAVSHLSSHMYTSMATPELRALSERLAAEYKLPLEAPQAKSAGHWRTGAKTPEAMVAEFVAILEKLAPGLYLFIEHPGLDTPEMRAISHKGNENVARDRAGVTHVMTSDAVKDAVKRKGIRLMSYADLFRQ